MIKYLGSPNGLITANQIADGSILGSDITANTIANTKLADLTITGDKVASNTIANLKISDTAAIIYSKLTLANSIVNADINTVAGIVNTKLAAGTLTNTEINASAAIVGSKLADVSIANTKLVAGSIYNAEINAAANIVGSKLADVSIANTKLVAGSIYNAEINAAANIALTKLANISAGRVLIGNATNIPTATLVSGDITITDAGLVTIGTDAIINTNIVASTITGDRIAANTIGNAKLSTAAGDIAGAWVSFTPTTTNIGGTVSISGRHITIGKTYSFRIVLTTGTVASGASDVIITLPVTASSALGGLYPVNVIGPLGVTTYAFISGGGGNIIFRNQVNGLTTSTGGGIFGATVSGGATNTAFNIYSGNTYSTGFTLNGTTISGTIELA